MPCKEVGMIKNIGLVDKTVRFLLGIVLIFLGFYSSYWFIVLGVFLLFTATIGWCPIYSILGINTNKVKPKARSAKKKRR